MSTKNQETQRRILPALLFIALLAGAFLAASAAMASNMGAAPSKGLAAGAINLNSPQSTPTAGTVSPGAPANWSGTVPGSGVDYTTCVYGVNCDSFKLTVTTPGNYDLAIRIQWPLVSNDLDLYVCKGTDANPCANGVVADSAQSTTTFEEVDLPGGSFNSGDVLYAVTVGSIGGTTYTGTATLNSLPAPTPTQPPAQGIAPRFQDYAAPGTLGSSAGEPSIGSDWRTEQNGNGGTAMFQAVLQTLRVTFDITCTGALWQDVSSPYTSIESLDPILFTDHNTGRTIVSQLTGQDSAGSYTDDDGNTYMPTIAGGVPAGPDHQTVGAGPYSITGTVPPPPTRVYTDAVYYCSQGVATAFCSRSDDGAQNFGAGVPLYDITQCGGLHGHVKVAPNDGTVYVPNKGCGGMQAVAVSDGTDPIRANGNGFVLRTIPGSTAGNTDPSVGVGSDGTLYEGMQGANSHPYIAISSNRGTTWSTPVDVGASLGIQNAVFPAVSAGDGDRAAFAFIGTTTGGNYQDPVNFHGVWYLYVAVTYDRGQSWFLINATPNDPVQRGSICTGGTTCGTDRNLLDFIDNQIDKEGRILVAYADGCIGSCVQGGANSFSAKASIARESGGRSLFAAYDSMFNNTTVPAAPNVTATTDGRKVHLNWNVPDDGNSPITGYNVYRSDNGGALTRIATVVQTSYDDANIQAGHTYAYQVTAVNAVGESQACGTVTPTYMAPPDPCTLPGTLVITDDADSPPNVPPDPSVDIQKLYVAEPYMGANVNALVFTLQVGSSTTGAPPPSSQWYILWNRTIDPPDPTYDRNYVAMKTDATGTPSFEYGQIQCPAPTCVPGNAPTRLGAADAGSYDAVGGTIVITIANSKLDNVMAGQDLPQLQVRTFYSRPDGQPVTQTASSDFSPMADYTLLGNQSCGTGGGTPTATAIAQSSATSTRTAIVGSSATSTNTAAPSTTGIPNTYTATATRTSLLSSPTSTPGTPSPTSTGRPATYTATATNTSNPLATATSSPTTCPVQFQDVPVSSDPSSFYPYVRCLACRSILGGYPCGGVNPITHQAEPCGASGNPYFRPVNNISRGQIAKIVSNAAGYNDQIAGQTYADVTPSNDPSSFYSYIERLTRRGIMQGYACGTSDPRSGPCDAQNRAYFRPANNATRGQLTKIVANTAGYTEGVTGQSFTDLPPSSDPSSYYQYVERLTRRGVISGYPCGSAGEICDSQDRPYFRPAAAVTRAQAAKIVSNTFFPNCQTR